jgi:hypothetical protein
MTKKEPEIRYRRDLHQLLQAPGPAAEIGVAEGNFSCDMLQWRKGASTFPAITKLYMVDRWAQVATQKGDAAMPPDWHENNLRQVWERTKENSRAVILRGDSVEMAKKVPNESLQLLYIDGDHSYEGVLADLRAWNLNVKSGGSIALHDYLNPAYGVKQAVHDFCEEWQMDIHTIEEDKPEDAGCWFRVD